MTKIFRNVNMLICEQKFFFYIEIFQNKILLRALRMSNVEIDKQHTFIKKKFQFDMSAPKKVQLLYQIPSECVYANAKCLLMNRQKF